MDVKQEILEGYVIDMACVRKYPIGELFDRAKAHTQECALMGHCIESGYGLVGEDGRVAVLDSAATPHVVDVLHACEKDSGITLHVTREAKGEEMHTTHVEQV